MTSRFIKLLCPGLLGAMLASAQAQTVSFTDTLPAGLRVASPSTVGGTCTGGTVTATALGSSIVVAGRQVPAGGASATTCTNVWINFNF